MNIFKYPAAHSLGRAELCGLFYEDVSKSEGTASNVWL